MLGPGPTPEHSTWKSFYHYHKNVRQPTLLKKGSTVEQENWGRFYATLDGSPIILEIAAADNAWQRQAG